MGLTKEEQQVRIPHIHVPSDTSSRTIITTDDFVRIFRYASSKYAEETESIRSLVPVQIIETFENMASQCEALARRFENLMKIDVHEIDSSNTYAVRFIDSLEITSLLEHDCPRCFRSIPNEVSRGEYLGAMSRIDNETEICSDCGNAEALMGYEAMIAHR